MWSVNKAMEMASHGGEETADGGGERKREKERERFGEEGGKEWVGSREVENFSTEM